MKSNIVVISFLDTFKKKVAKSLADSLSLYYVDVLEFMEFNLINLSDVLKNCGADYLNKLESKTIRDISEFENTVITLENHQLFYEKNIENLQKTSVIVYLKNSTDAVDKNAKLSELESTNLEVENLVKDEREANIEKISEIIVEIHSLNVDNVVKKVIKAINLHYN